MLSPSYLHMASAIGGEKLLCKQKKNSVGWCGQQCFLVCFASSARGVRGTAMAGPRPDVLLRLWVQNINLSKCGGQSWSEAKRHSCDGARGEEWLCKPERHEHEDIWLSHIFLWSLWVWPLFDLKVCSLYLWKLWKYKYFRYSSAPCSHTCEWNLLINL